MPKNTIIEDDTEVSGEHEQNWPSFIQDEQDQRLDHFVQEAGQLFAGRHLLIDLWGAQKLDDISHIESAIREAAIAASATLLHIHLHHFTPNGGVSGVAILAESHISIHSWPERNYAAFDVFMCGRADPQKTIKVFQRFFTPEKIDIKKMLRGQVS